MTSSSRPNSGCNRREFLGNSARNAAGVAAGVFGLGMSPAQAKSPNEAIRIGILGTGVQGRELAMSLAKFPDVRLMALCDVDVQSVVRTQHDLADEFEIRPVICANHEQLLDRSDLDAVVIATPDHWHARMAADALRAGKDLYLEQPVAHTVEDGETLLTLARQSGRIVQTGLPQRSGAHFQSAVELIRSGELGRVHLARAWAVHKRRSLGRMSESAAPQGVDYERWLGPAPARPFQANRFHQTWPFFWDYGSGELGLWGVQLLDFVRWGLDLDLPTRISATGGRRVFHDDRETPDTLSVQFEFPEIEVIWEHRQWSHHGIEGRPAATAFYGERGTLVVDRSGWKVYDQRNGLFADASECRQNHLRDWLSAIRESRQPAASLEVGQRSMILAHLGNMSYRLGRELRFDPESLTFGSDQEANRLLGGTAREPWHVTEV